MNCPRLLTQQSSRASILPLHTEQCSWSHPLGSTWKDAPSNGSPECRHLMRCPPSTGNQRWSAGTRSARSTAAGTSPSSGTNATKASAPRRRPGRSFRRRISHSRESTGLREGPLIRISPPQRPNAPTHFRPQPLALTAAQARLVGQSSSSTGCVLDRTAPSQRPGADELFPSTGMFPAVLPRGQSVSAWVTPYGFLVSFPHCRCLLWQVHSLLNRGSARAPARCLVSSLHGNAGPWAWLQR